MSNVIAMIMGIVLGSTVALIVLSAQVENKTEPSIWCYYGEFTKEEWEQKENKPDVVSIEFNGTDLIVRVKC